jgi:hypothetical protein
MTMFEEFSHYVSYGATDQQTLRDLQGQYSGVVVPGTIAAYQRQGTGGFVLSLSATPDGPPYVIDPRFPLFQQRLRSPRQSHRALAELLGHEELVRADAEPTTGDFPDRLLDEIAGKWVGFNRNYETAQSEKFAKYARRLKTPLPEPGDIKPPERILAPYFMADGALDPWWALSKRLWAATEALGHEAVRVVAAKSVAGLADMLPEVADREVVVWVSGLDEMTTGYRELRAYAEALGSAAERGTRAFALYGGFYHVLMRLCGLSGLSHGVGFGESRVWEELPQSGPPPARYYVRRIHRYLPQDLANSLWLADRDLTECPCPDCVGKRPLELDYHALMRHSVAARTEEIRAWSQVDRSSVAQVLRDEHAAFERALRRPSVPGPVGTRAREMIAPLETWADAFDPPPGPG